MAKNLLIFALSLILFMDTASAFLNGFYSGEGTVSLNNGKCIIWADVQNDKTPDHYLVKGIYYECEIEPGIYIAQALGATILKKEVNGELSYDQHIVGKADSKNFYFVLPGDLYPKYDFTLNDDGSVAVSIKKDGDRPFEVRGVLKTPTSVLERPANTEL